VLNRVYANVLNKPVLIPKSDVTSLGSAIFAALAAGAFRSLEEAQDALCPEYRIVEPDAKSVQTYEELYALYRELYFAFGSLNAFAIYASRVLPTLRRVAAVARGNA
jgi:L-ribulokinase